MGKVEDKMRPPDPVIILIGRTIMNLGKYIVYKISLLLQKGDDYLSDRMPIWFSNTRYYREKRIVDNALKSVYKVKVSEQNIRDWKGTDHTPLDLGYKQKEEERAIGEGDNFPDVVMNGNWKQVHR
jgi:hypothetical protein